MTRALTSSNLLIFKKGSAATVSGAALLFLFAQGVQHLIENQVLKPARGTDFREGIKMQVIELERILRHTSLHRYNCVEDKVTFV